MAPRTVLTADVLDQIAAMSAAGATREVMADRLGVCPRTITTARARLRREGRLGEPAARVSRREVEREFAEAASDGSVDALLRDPRLEGALVRVLVRAAQSGSVSSAKFLLAHAAPERWGSSPEQRPPAPSPDDPFHEVDELAAERRRRRPG